MRYQAERGTPAGRVPTDPEVASSFKVWGFSQRGTHTHLTYGVPLRSQRVYQEEGVL